LRTDTQAHAASGADRFIYLGFPGVFIPDQARALEDPGAIPVAATVIAEALVSGYPYFGNGPTLFARPD
jgi:hypothetical protein